MSECLIGLKPYVSGADCLLTGNGLALGIFVLIAFGFIWRWGLRSATKSVENKKQEAMVKIRAYGSAILDEVANEVADCFENEEDYFPVRAAILKMKEEL